MSSTREGAAGAVGWIGLLFAGQLATLLGMSWWPVLSRAPSCSLVRIR